MARDPLVYLEDIVFGCERVREYTFQKDFSQFEGDPILVDAVLRNLEIIGEAAKNVPESIRSLSDDTEWKRVAGFRDVLAHAYFAVNLATVWDIVQTKIDPLRNSVSKLITRLVSKP